MSLRPVAESDAAYTTEIRQDSEKTKFLHAVDNDIEKQTAWIRRQREAAGDYFFIAGTPDGEDVGTVGVYDIEGKKGCLGRLLMTGNPFQTFEATLLAMEFAYDTLGLSELYGDVVEGNSASYNLSEAFGFHFEEPVYSEELKANLSHCVSYGAEFDKYAAKIRELIYRE